MRKPALFFDFDNTLTRGDILDSVIESFSPSEDWRAWEAAWADGRLSAMECLRRQVEGLRVTQQTLFEFLSRVRIDTAFVQILQWCRRRDVPISIVSDSFVPMIRHMLSVSGIDDIPVIANDLAFDGDRLRPSFPFHDPSCVRSANAKARHLEPYRGHTLVYAGDGRSDLDPALIADVVFAKGALARELDTRAIAYTPFDTLTPVLAYLKTLEGTEAWTEPGS
jgi:2-hydroxy-3-keto-5-methylthiopentenyl-1-phosphate phosphatase